MSILTGDCVEVMAGMDAESIDAIVTDPPYGLEFMGKEWDRLGRDGLPSFVNTGTRAVERRPGRGDGGSNSSTRYHDKPRFSTLTGESMRAAQQWHTRWATEALRVAKPGAYLLAFGGTRTVHRLTVALEDAGWVIRDLLVWAYASGFPKSKSSLKPAWEPIVLARKPGPLAALNIDGCRIGTTVETWPATRRQYDVSGMQPGGGTNGHTDETGSAPAGRWPANVILTDPIFDGGWDGVEGGGESKPATGRTKRERIGGTENFLERTGDLLRDEVYGDTGTYSRFFLIPKASRRDREPDVPGEGTTPAIAYGNRVCRNCGHGQFDGRRKGPCCDHPDYVVGQVGKGGPRRNTHPTVKPTRLMRHLIRLVTPAGGTVLDPFLGSGTTAKAAVLEGFDWVGIEREPEYVRVAEQRLVGLEPEPEQLQVPA